MVPTVILLISLLASTVLYLYLHRKTRIRLKYLFIDNVAVALMTAGVCYWLFLSLPTEWRWTIGILLPGFVLGFGLMFTMGRFWRTPKRKIAGLDNDIVSPADGNVIYIKRVEPDQTPISIKGKGSFQLDELTKTTLLDRPCWLIGINMTPFDVHKNCAPVDGTVVLNQPTPGPFLSLKNPAALTENERRTYVIEGQYVTVGVVQIASRLVRRIDSYVDTGATLSKGDWIGMIRFGSQVDLIAPADAVVLVELGQQVYAGETIVLRTDRKNRTGAGS